ncbi:UNVERIFIED_CONTAM: hypothetical protein PYX00_011748 [Menopon gallinae]|uniref:40S ribosomal protein S6 n=1 Tax=Menopon gallinae TaxID=328185 RepID=A0AAW2H8K9_9NEOP
MIPIDFQTSMRLYGQKLGAQIEGELLGEDFRGYVFKITGGDDVSGLPMKNGVFTDKRVRLLLRKGSKGYRCREKGVRRRKSVRGCIISGEIAVVSMIILKEGEKPIEGLTDRVVECSHLPKRATKLRKLFNIPKDADIVEFIKEQIRKNSDSEKIKYPRIKVTRLVTPERIERKKKRLEEKAAKRIKSERERKEYMEKYYPEKVGSL